MARKKLSKTDILKSFDLTAYDICLTWGAKEWATALAVRMSLQSLWRDSTDPSFTEEAEKLFHDHLQYFGPTLEIFDGQSLIRDQSLRDFIEDANLILDAGRYAEWGDPITVIDNRRPLLPLKPGDTPVWRLHADHSGKKVHKRFITVNFGAPDELLAKEFMKWIKQARKEMGIARVPRQYNDTDFAKWHKQRLLPYLDLTFWATTRNAQFTQEGLGDILFPSASLAADSSIDLAELMRKTIKPNAQKLLSHEVVSALQVQLLYSTEHQASNKNKKVRI